MPAPRTDRPPRRIAFLIAGFGMFGPFSIDAIFPGFRLIAKDLAASPVMMQQIISVYLVGFGLMSLFHGPLSDALGRRKVVLWSTVVFVLASAGAALSSSLEILLAWRLIQGCSAGGGVIIGRAIIRDLATGPVAQQMIAQVMMIFAVSPAVAPIAGAFLCGLSGWRAVFWAVGLFAGLVLLVAGLALPESLPVDHRHRFNFGSLLQTYRRITSDHQFMLLSMSNALNFGALFLYISSAPRFIFDFLHLSSHEFYWLFVPAVTGIVAGSAAAMRTSGRFADSIVLRLGFGIMMTAWIANSAMTAVLHYPPLPWAVLPIGVHAFGMALNQPLLTLLALERFPKQRGAASSMQAFLSLGVNAAVAGLVSAAVSINPLTLSAAAFALNATGLILWLLTGRAKEVSAHQVIADETIIAE